MTTGALRWRNQPPLSGNSVTGTTSFTLTGLSTRSAAIIAVSWLNGPGTITLPDGWEIIRDGINSPFVGIYYTKYNITADPVVSWVNSFGYYYACHVFNPIFQFDNAKYVDVQVGTLGTSEANPTAPGITTIAPNATVIALTVSRNISAMTPPSGWSHPRSISSGSNLSIHLCQKYLATPGASGDAQFTQPSTQQWPIQIALALRGIGAAAGNYGSYKTGTVSGAWATAESSNILPGWGRTGGAWTAGTYGQAASYGARVDQTITTTEADGDSAIGQIASPNTQATIGFDTAVTVPTPIAMASLRSSVIQNAGGSFADDNASIAAELRNSSGTVLASTATLITSLPLVNSLDRYDIHTHFTLTSAGLAATPSDWAAGHVYLTFTDVRSMGADGVAILLVDYELILGWYLFAPPPMFPNRTRPLTHLFRR